MTVKADVERVLTSVGAAPYAPGTTGYVLDDLASLTAADIYAPDIVLDGAQVIVAVVGKDGMDEDGGLMGIDPGTALDLRAAWRSAVLMAGYSVTERDGDDGGSVPGVEFGVV